MSVAGDDPTVIDPRTVDPVREGGHGPDPARQGGRGPRADDARPLPGRPRRRRPAKAAAPEQYGHSHRDITGGWARAAVFGVSDGLVTNVSLVLGMAGANPGPTLVRLAGVAGLVAGACSMAAGEYVSMRAQAELLERELSVERDALARRPEVERRELIHIYEGRGVAPDVARQLADEMMRTPELALDTHAREELGVDPQSLGSPVKAAVSSFLTFALGAVLPLIPWLAGGGGAAVVASVVIGAVAAVAVGAALSLFTRRRMVWSAVRQLLISAGAAAVTYGIGVGVGAGTHP